MKVTALKKLTQPRLNMILTGFSKLEEEAVLHPVEEFKKTVFEVSFSAHGVHLESTTLNCLISKRDLRRFFRPAGIRSWFWFTFYNAAGGSKNELQY